MRRAVLVVVGALLVARPSAARLLDGFEDLGAWTAHPADGVRMRLVSGPGLHGKALGIEFAFAGGGWAIARKAVSIDLPADWAFAFQVRGTSGINHLEFKLVDATDENVWWYVRRDFAFPKEWRRLVTKKRQVAFAWGPAGGGEIRHVAAIELVVTAATGGSGTVWFDDLELREQQPTQASGPVATASSSQDASAPRLALDADSTTAWRAHSGDRRPWYAIDFGAPQEFGGLTVHWVPGRGARDYDVLLSDDGVAWQTVRRIRDGNGGRDDLFMPESESRWVRLAVRRAAGRDGVAVSEIVVRPPAWSATRNAFFEAIAAESPPGLYPRAMSGQQSYWTVVGADGDPRESLFDEDGRIETRGGAALEPFLWLEGSLAGWHESPGNPYWGDLGFPMTHRQRFDVHLDVAAFAVGPPGASGVVVRYVISNVHDPAGGRLFLALRPFQVNPPAQFLNGTGGATPVRELEARGDALFVNGERAAVSLTRPAGFGASTFDGGDVVADFLRAGRLPPQVRVADEFEAASGAWAYEFAIAPGETFEVDVFLPLHTGAAVPRERGAAARAWVLSQLGATRTAWDAKTSRVEFELPRGVAPDVLPTLRTQLVDILVNRAGPAIQPGARAYARSWIRDGALTSSALLRLGHDQPVREFLEWFAPHQYTSGKIPCVVDRRGADPVPEHDSSGEYIFLVAEFLRFTGDRGLAERHLPRVLRAAAYLDSLRQTRRTPEFTTGDARRFYGLLPPSISHEGYSAKPMHSYWDDFWAARGFRDAAYLAAELGREAERERLTAIATEFERDVAASVEAAMRHHGIDYVPGCADLGDFDATSTTIALAPTDAARILPADAVRRTFEKYDAFFRDRQRGVAWEAFTPYEIRNIGAFVRLGWRARSQELLAWFLTMQKPPGWKQWPEVVWREDRVPRFLGDLPHTWVGSDYIRSFVDLFAYERAADETLVLGAGLPLEWLADTGTAVRDLRTPYGPLSFAMRAEGETVTVQIEAGTSIPPGGIAVRAPLPEGARRATVNGTPATLDANGEVVVRALPATVVVGP